MPPAAIPDAAPRGGTPREVLLAFLKLGLTCFGGPVAHLGYFRQEFVVRRRWIDDAAYADLVGLCQFLPGPASSQVGFALGLGRAGAWGGLAAWAGFTLPSALLLVAFAALADRLAGPLGLGLLHGLKLVAVAIVAQAVWGMARSLCPDGTRAAIAAAASLIVLSAPSAAAQIGAILAGALAGWRLCRRPATPPPPDGTTPLVSPRVGIAALAAYLALLVGLPLLTHFLAAPLLALAESCYRAGALVFGGGHVVLPLLREAFVTPGWIDDGRFLAGYGAAQAVPGPLFTFAAYLGASVETGAPRLVGATLALVSIFLPGLLILLAALPFWHQLRRGAQAQAAMRGINATVVGLLAAALYDPIWTGTIHTPTDLALALAGFALLTMTRTPPWIVVALSATAGLALSF
ncbi:chromate efflux transporter [Phaeospirillum tilakii]|uniref:Chromate efflux transporter n=1 Tax=Phaeospirillum tilakii TaxID=741673 RepID=A0ABW5C9K9_9PROT